ncbi:MAG TPA: HEXXH motif-containing putative peptide modification protein [Phenylobacterium sp.]|nr:HEXXH motif-containing putative peptide modification protein [Phenylobacterium sp.]
MTPRLDEPWRLPGLEISVAVAPLSADWLWPLVVPAPIDITAHVRASGLQLAEIRLTDSGLFAKAAEAIAWAPSLAAIVATRVASVHLLQAEPGYDVSHSEPHWRDRIFVSIPDRSDEVGAMRLAEGIIHEALHLHLTELEAITPLVRDRTGRLASPWRLGPRSFGGVLHGAFVFVSLQAYFDAVTAPSESAVGVHLDQRRAEIADELSQVDLATLAAGLTDDGKAFLAYLLGERAGV